MSDVLAQNVRHVFLWFETALRKIRPLREGDLPERRERADPPLFSGEKMEEGFRQLAFTFAVIALGAKLAGVDGEIKQEEFSAFCNLFPMPNEEYPKLQRLFFMAQNDPNSIGHYARQISGLFPERLALKEELLKRLCKLAEVDGRIMLSERRMLEEIALALELDPQAVSRYLVSGFTGKRAATPYELLGVASHHSNQEVKQAYRNRIRELHPDRLTGEGYAQEDISHAQAELAAVNEAYVIIARKRKIK